MSWFLRVTALVLALGLALPLLAQDAKKPDAEKKDEKKDDKKPDDPKPDDKKKDDEKEKKEKLLPAGTLQGKIMKLDEDKRTMKVEVTFYVPKLNEGEAKAFLDAQNALRNAAGNPTLRPGDRAQQMAKAQFDMQTHYAKLYTNEKKTQEVDLQIMDEAKIRVATPPLAFNDDGKVKKYTKKELDELKGPDPKLPGYTSEYGALATGEMIQVTLVRKKDAKPPMRPMGVGVGLPKPKDVVADADPLADHLPLVSMIVIMQQGENK